MNIFESKIEKVDQINIEIIQINHEQYEEALKLWHNKYIEQLPPISLWSQSILLRKNNGKLFFE